MINSDYLIEIAIIYSSIRPNGRTFTLTFNKLFSTKDIDKMILNLEWKHGLLYAFGYNPLICECGTEMIYNYEKSYFPKKYEGENSS